VNIRESIAFIAIFILYFSSSPIHANNHNKDVKQLDQSKKLGFYTSISVGRVYSDNSATFIKGIKAIAKKAIGLMESRWGEGAASWIIGNTFDIGKFNDQINVDFQWLVSTSLGYYAAENGRIDFEAMYSRLNIIDNNRKRILDESAGIFTFLLNFYYNPRIKDTQFSPYISLGVGPTIFRLKKINEPNKDLMPLNIPWFAYQVKLGVDYSITPEVKTFLGYRYFNIPVPVADAIATHNIEVGLLFNF
jgi:opacity protein-like surface antigen